MNLADDHGMCFLCGRHPALPGMICPTCEASQEIMDSRASDIYFGDAGDENDAEDNEEWKGAA